MRASGVRAIEGTSLALVAVNIFLPILAWSPWAASHRLAVGEALGVTWEANPRLLGLVLGILGASNAGRWAMHYVAARFGLRPGNAWGWRATWVGLVAWLVVAVAAGLATNAGVHLEPVFFAPTCVFAGLCLFVRLSGPWQSVEPVARTPSHWPLRAVVLSSMIGVGSGLMIAFAGDTFVFAPWFDGLAHFALSSGPESEALARSFFGAIGAAVTAQFAVIVMVARGPLGRRPELAWACAATLLLWFVVDSAYGLAHGGLFNVMMVNVPTLILALPPLVWVVLAGRRFER